MVATAVTAYFSYVGFTVNTEVSGEMQNPRRNIPRALVISFAFVVLLYVATAYVFTGVMHWQEAGQLGAALAQAAAWFLPPSMVTFAAGAGGAGRRRSAWVGRKPFASGHNLGC